MTDGALDLRMRPATPADAETCAGIFFDAFAAIADAHNFPCEPGSPEFTRRRTAWLLAHPGFHGVVAEHDGRIVGGNFVDERAAITGIGPLVVARAGPRRGPRADAAPA